MDKARMDTSPSEQSFIEVHAVYHHLGRSANRIANWLRLRGYSAQAGHPLKGTPICECRLAHYLEYDITAAVMM